MNTDRTAMEQALAALRTGKKYIGWEATFGTPPEVRAPASDALDLAEDAIAALRDRLDQPMQEGEREAFEAWAPTQNLCLNGNDGDYVFRDARSAWFAWQARASLASQGAAQAIHYPECWDTAAYPTLESALSEVYAGFRCTNQDTHPSASQGTAPLEQPQPDVHSASGEHGGSYDGCRPMPRQPGSLMPGYVVACRFGVYEARAFDLAEQMYAAFFSALPHHRSAAGDQEPNVQDLTASARLSQLEALLEKAREALDEIALAGMSGTGMESEEAMRDWHARQAWKFIGIAARAKSDIAALGKEKQG